MERGETSPTAALLGRLCAAHETTMSRLLADIDSDPPRLVREADQAIWVDPETGFRRRAVSPPGRGYRVEIIAGELPAGASIAYEIPSVEGLEHHLWMLGGLLVLSVEGTSHQLAGGDALRYRLFGPSRFFSPGPEPARYLLAICPP
jgi:glyoxylate utilization-related uncharacterized protein